MNMTQCENKKIAEYKEEINGCIGVLEDFSDALPDQNEKLKKDCIAALNQLKPLKNDKNLTDNQTKKWDALISEIKETSMKYLENVIERGKFMDELHQRSISMEESIDIFRGTAKLAKRRGRCCGLWGVFSDISSSLSKRKNDSNSYDDDNENEQTSLIR